MSFFPVVHGCTAHKIKNYDFIYRDYRNWTGTQERRRNELSGIHCIEDELENNDAVKNFIQ